MGNFNYQYGTFEMLQFVVSKFGQSYNELVSYGTDNEVLDAAIQAFINKIYRDNIAKLCNISSDSVSDDVVRYIQYGTQYEQMISDGNFTMFRRPYTDKEVIAIVSGQVNNYNNVSVSNPVQSVKMNNENSNVMSSVSQNVEVQQQREEVEKTLPVENEVIEKKDDSTLKVENESSDGLSIEYLDEGDSVAASSINLDAIDDVVEDVEYSVPNKDESNVVSSTTDTQVVEESPNGKIASIKKQYAELYKKYTESGKQNLEELKKISDAEVLAYKNAISELTGIKVEDIKDFVVNYVLSGTTENKTDENGKVVSKVRSLNDEEVKLIVQYINNLSEDEVKNMLKS